MFTDRQVETLNRIPESDRDYQAMVYETAHRAYGLIPEKYDPRKTAKLLEEVTELFNSDAWNVPLPRQRYSRLSQRIVATVEKDGSLNSASSSITELKKMLEELRDFPFTPTGLTGAVIEKTPEYTTTVKPGERI